MCEEHALAHKLAADADDLRAALEMLHEWIQEGAPSDDSPAGDILRDGLYHQREELERRYFNVLVKERGAALVATGAHTGPNGAREFPPSLEAVEALAL